MSFILILLFLCSIISISTTRATLLFKDDFEDNIHPFDITSPQCPYSYAFLNASNLNIKMNVNLKANGMIKQRVMPFSLTTPKGAAGILDHVKLLQYTKTYFNITPPFRKLKYSLRFASTSTGTNIHPFQMATIDNNNNTVTPVVTNPYDDPRLSCCGMTGIDMLSQIIADLLVTSEGIWVRYGRLPFLQNTPGGKTYHSFISVKRVASRNNIDINNMRIEYDKLMGTLEWFVENNRVFRIEKIGLIPPLTETDAKIIVDYGGDDDDGNIVAPQGFQWGWGCFTMLDAKDPLNMSSEKGLVKLSDESVNAAAKYKSPVDFFENDAPHGSRLWGQGADITIHKLKVEKFK